MDAMNKALMLELAYRLTVAVNIANHKLESLAWMESWNTSMLGSARKFRESLLFSKINKGQALRAVQVADEIVDGLAQGYFSPT